MQLSEEIAGVEVRVPVKALKCLDIDPLSAVGR